MQWATASCLILSVLLSSPTIQAAEQGKVRFCFICEIEEPVPVDSFCQSYRPLIQKSGDGEELRKMRDDIRRRSDANDTFYRCRCKGWKNPICETTKPK